MLVVPRLWGAGEGGSRSRSRSRSSNVSARLPVHRACAHTRRVGACLRLVVTACNGSAHDAGVLTVLMRLAWPGGNNPAHWVGMDGWVNASV